MSDILDLPNWTLLDRTQEDGCDVLDAEYRLQPSACPKCGTIGYLYRHGTKLTNYLDIPLRGAPAKLRAKVQRYRCRSCAETFLQPLGGVLDDRRMTERCAAFIQANCLRDTFTRIAEDVGCDDKTVRSLASEYMASLDSRYRPELPEWLGVDEIQIAGQMRLVLTDVSKRRVIDMLPSRDKGTLAGWLRQFPDLKPVKGVAIDMYTEAVNEVVKTVNRTGRGYSFEVFRARLLFGRKAKPEQQTWLLVSAFDTSVMAIRHRLEEQNGRCGTCGVEIGRAADKRPVAATLVRRSTKKQVVICHACLNGFDTLGLFR